MSLQLLPSNYVIRPNNVVPFEGVGGAPPYTYSVQGGGAGGTIDVDGVYTAPNTQGFDTIIVTDSVAVQTTSTVIINNPIKLVCDIIQKELNLDDSQVYIYDQKINIPTDSKMYVIIGVVNAKPFGNSCRLDDNGNEVQSVNMLTTLSIDILSRSTEALDRKEEIILALESIYAQSQQELNGFYVAKLSTGFVNLSEVDGAAIPYRFNISVNIQYAMIKTKAVPYYDSFDAPEIEVES